MLTTKRNILFLQLFMFFGILHAQNVQDDFEGNGTINLWSSLDCALNTGFPNPVSQGINTSSTVLRYHDFGGAWCHIRFETGHKLNIATHPTFSFKIYVPSSSVTGNQTNEVTIKLQNSKTLDPWKNQVSISKPIILDQWQEVQFDFLIDAFDNFDVNAPAPEERVDLDRVVIQINGEDNPDQVIAYIDDFFHEYFTPLPPSEIYDQLIWSDEFDNSGPIDSSKWHHQTLFPVGSSWFSGEIQHYTDREDNSYVQNGSLLIVAKKESYSDQGVTKTHTSARLNSKFAFKYGRVEVRAKLPAGMGTWPAIWMLGKNIDERGAYFQTQGFGTVSWPYCGEMDIIEHWGNHPNEVFSAIHTPQTWLNTSGWMVQSGGQQIPTALTDFHVYSVEWTAEKIAFSVDGQVHYTYKPASKNPHNWPFHEPHYLLLNIAIQPIVDPNLTQTTMEVDYVRVYQKSEIGLSEREKLAQLLVFPNPVVDRLQIEFSNCGNSEVEFEILDMGGRLVDFGSVKFDSGSGMIEGLERLKEGVYILRLGSKVIRFIK